MACFYPAVPFNSNCKPPDIVKKAFEDVTGEKGVMDAADLAQFMRNVQGDESATEEEARKAMNDFISHSWEKSSSISMKLLGFRNGSHGGSGSWRRRLLAGESSDEAEAPTFTLRAFLKFLLDPIFNQHRAPMSKTPTEDMTAPLSDYFIFASHNTYLTGNQLTSESSTYPIAKALDSGCRVIELDCWSGPDGRIAVLDCCLNGSNRKINVLHGRTLTKAVDFEACIKTIRDHAFTNSEYPVILTIENHMNQEHQKVAAKSLKKILGKLLFIPSANDLPPKSFQSPQQLKNFVIISDKPLGDSLLSQVAEDPEFTEKLLKDSVWKRAPKGLKQILRDVVCFLSAKDPPLKPAGDVSLSQVGEDPDSSDLEDVSHSPLSERRIHRRQNQFVDEVRVLKSRSMSPVSDDPRSPDEPKDPEFEQLLYIHCQKPSEMDPRHVKGCPLIAGENAIMANLSESQLDDVIGHHPNSLITFSHTNLGRVYPFGLRFNSSNADPMHAWRHGIQVAAINMQGRDRPVWISRAFFSKNGGCGYVKKPDILLRGSSFRYGHKHKTELQPKLELKVRVLLGTDWHKNFDLFKQPDYYVKVAVHGMYGDKVKKCTKVVNRSREPHWENEEFTFKIRVPELAILRLEVKEHDMFRDDMVGQSCVPVTGIRQGIRAVELQSSRGHPRKSKLLCHFTMSFTS